MAATLRLLSYNVRSLRDDADAVARLIRAADPDVVLLQEAPRFWRWRSKLAALAREAGLLYVNGGRPTGGVALLAHLRVEVRDAREGLLTKRPGLHQRGLAAAVVSRGGTRLLVASTHLGLDRQEREVHAGEVLSLLATVPAPHAVLAGDLNEPPGGPVWVALRAGGLRDLGAGSGPTYPARAPRKRIDAVLGSPRLERVDYRVVDDPAVARASDHRPVLALVRVPD